MSMNRKYEKMIDVESPGDDAQSKLEFQNFVLSEAESNLLQGKISPAQKTKSAAASPAQVFAATSSSTAQELPAPAQQQEKQYSFWQIEYYAKFFNVDTVLSRLRLATVPFFGSFKEAVGTNPDLYGPFWTTTTVMFFMFVANCMAASIDAYLNDKTYNYDFTVFSYACAVFYGYISVIPLILFLTGKYFSATVSFLELINVYGYGTGIWMIVSLVCIAPGELVRWVSVGVAGALSALHIAISTKYHKMVFLVAMCLHGAFVLAMKILFYK